ncbi:MAG: hypothetical protein ACP5HQ_00560 [Thermoprotei archaeon]
MKYVIIKLSDEEYRELEQRARHEGYSLVTDYVRNLVFTCKGSSAQPIDVSLLSSKLERKIQDVLMPFTSEIDAIKRELAGIHEKLDKLSVPVTPQPVAQEKPRPVREERAAYQEKPKEGEKKKTAMELLKDQGVVYESELSLRNPDAYFAKLESEGARIIVTERERIAAHPDFFEKFVNDLSQLRTPDVSEASSRLSEKEAKLFRKLVNEGLAYFDSESQSWKLLV